MKFLCLLLAACGLSAAEPDWPKIEARALDLFQQYIRIQSIDPPADTREAAAFFKAELERHGLKPKLYPSGPDGKTNLIVRIPGKDRSKKPLLLLNHFDVVPVDAKAWKMDPFGGLIDKGFVWGRGALDMKGIGIQHLTALTTIHDAGILPPRDVVMLTTADEENKGTYGIMWMIEHHFDEIDAEYVLDEGGFASREMLAPNQKLIFGIAVAEKQVSWIRIRATGTAGHGSQPIPDNANLRLLRAIEKALAAPDNAKPHPLIAEMRTNIGGPLAENKYTSAIQKNTMSLTTLTAGVGSPVKVNVIPSTSEATIDCRLLPGVNAAEFVSEVRARINDPKVTVESIGDPMDAGASRSDTPLFRAIAAAFRKQHPEAIVTPMIVPHGTDSVKLRMKGITAYGVTPMVLDPATLGTMHSDEERLPVEEFKKGIHVFFDVLRSEW